MADKKFIIKSEVDTTQSVSSLKKLEKQTDKTASSVKRAKKASSGLGKSLLGIGASMFGLGAAIGLVTSALKSAFETMVNYERANSKLKAVLKATSEEMSILSDESLRLGSSTKYTAIQVAELQIELAKLGFPTEDIIDMTEATLNGASALGSELGEQAALVGSVIKQFGLKASDATEVNDILAVSASNSALDFSKLATMLPIVGSTANGVGKDLKETTAILGKLADRGLDASSAATSLRNVYLRLEKQGMSMDEAMLKINGSTNKVKTSMEIFGVRASTAGLILAEVSGETTKLDEALQDTTDAAKKMARTMEDNLGGDITKAKSAWEGFILALTEGDSVISKSIRSTVNLTTSTLNLVTALMNGESAYKSFGNAGADELARLGFLSDEFNEKLGYSQKDLVKGIVNNKEVYEELQKQYKNGDISQEKYLYGLKKLATGFKFLTKAEQEARDEKLKGEEEDEKIRVKKEEDNQKLLEELEKNKEREKEEAKEKKRINNIIKNDKKNLIDFLEKEKDRDLINSKKGRDKDLEITRQKWDKKIELAHGNVELLKQIKNEQKKDEEIINSKWEDEQFRIKNELTLTDEEKEIQKINEQFEKKLETVNGNNELERLVFEEQQRLVTEISKKYRDQEAVDEEAARIKKEADEKASNKKILQNKLEGIERQKEGIQSVQNLNQDIFSIADSLGKQDEKSKEERARKQFYLNKAMNLGLAVMDARKAITTSLAMSPISIGPVPNPAGIASLAFAAATSAASIIKIAAMKYQPKKSSGTPPSTPTPSIPTSIPTPPELTPPSAEGESGSVFGSGEGSRQNRVMVLDINDVNNVNNILVDQSDRSEI